MYNPKFTTKTFKTTDEQISLLKDRNLIIRDEEKAKNFLTEKGYFDLINGFETLLLNPSLSKKLMNCFTL